MNEITRKINFTRVRRFLIAATMLIFFISGMGSSTVAASQKLEIDNPPQSSFEGPVHKVIAPQGVLNTELDGVTLWHDYGSFALYRVSEAALENLPTEVRAQINVLDDIDRLLSAGLASSPMGAQRGSSLGSEAIITSDESGAALQLVQFVGPIRDEWLRFVAAIGATPIQYIAPFGYLLWADADARAELDKMVQVGDFLESSVLYPMNLKVGPAIAGRTDPDEVVDVVIQMYRHPGGADSEAAVQSLTADQLSGWTPILEFQNLYATLRVGDVDEIVALPDVFWIDERLERQRMDGVQGQIMAGNFNADQSGPSAPGYLAWLDGFGFSANPADYPVVDVTDDGIGNGTVNSGDPTLNELGGAANPTRLSYVANCTNSASGEGPDGHGHINTSIVGGYDARSGFPFQDPLGYQRGMGINPYGRMAGTRIFNPGFDQSACGGSDTGVIKSIQDNGALINTNSWGCSDCAGTYDDSSQAYDVGVRDADLTEPGNQEMIVVFSSGNSGPSAGTVGTPGNGKNMITVGASENQRPSDEDGNWTDGCAIGPTGADNAMDVISFSSRGPSPGGRIKPEVIAPGTHIQGTASTNANYNGSGVCDQFRPSGQTTFAASSGTSHSTPAVAGTASLAYYWMENTYGVTTPSPAVMKAYLIAHPTYLTGVSANDTLPSNSQGYGMPDMGAMFDGADKFLIDQSVIFDNSGETWTWEGAVTDPSKPVRIVLAYTDAPGAIGTSPQVNDLNLAADVGGTAYLGNVFSGQWSVTGGSADPFNNYEAIFLPAGTTGSISITMTGFNIAGDGVPNLGDGTDQDFALVCYNCAQSSTFTLNVTPSSLDVCAPDDALYNVDVGSVLSFSDPVTLGASGNPAGTTANFSINPVTPPGSSTLTVGNTGAASAGSYSIDVSGTAGAETKTQSVDLNLFDIVPAGPDLLTPADGAVDVPFKPTFSWTAVAQASSYLLEVATDAGFTNIVYSTSVTSTSHTMAVPLSANTTYFWRVIAGNECGNNTSVTFSFTTQAATMVCNASPVDFEDGIPADWTVVDNTGGTGIVWTTTADPACGIPNLTNGTGEAACADSDAAGSGAPPYDTELVTNPFDLASYSTAMLDVKAYYNDLGTGNDRFEVDVWDGVSWTNALSWDENHIPEDFALNLSAYVGLPTVQVRFRYFGDGYDWYAQVDDVSLVCGQAPDIHVEPSILDVTLPEGGIETRTLTISNTGEGILSFSIMESEGTSTITLGGSLTFHSEELVSGSEPTPQGASTDFSTEPSISSPMTFALPGPISPDGDYLDEGPLVPPVPMDVTEPGPTAWASAASLPTARSRLASATDQGCLLYTIGGRLIGGAYSDTHEVYDPDLNTWRSLAPMPTERTNLGAAAVNGVIYVPGGYYDFSYLNTHDAYDIATNSWSSKAVLPVAAAGGVVAAVNGKVYHIGGGTDGGYVSTNYEYDPVTDSWSTKTAAPEAFAYANVTVLNGQIYVAGGWLSQTSASTRFWRYDPVTDDWAVLSSMNLGRQSPGLVAAGGYIYAFGGGVGWTARTSTEQYDPATDTWTIRSDSPLTMGRIGMASAWVRGRIWAAGGSTGGDATGYNEYLDEGYADNCGVNGVPWLSEDPTFGTVASGDALSVSVRFEPGDLPPGTYTARLIIANNDPDENPVIVPVTMTVSGNTQAIVRAGSGTVAPGGSIVIPVEALEVPVVGLGAATIEIHYDNTVLDATGCTADPGSVFDSALCNPDYSADTVRLTAISTLGVSVDSVLAEITFQAIGSSGMTSPLDVVIVTFTDTGGAPIPVNDEDGLVTIGADGDVNCDGTTNAVDALFILQREVGLRPNDSDVCPLPTDPPDSWIYRPGCDVSGDGTCDAVDALFILQCEVGIPNSFCPAPGAVTSLRPGQPPGSLPDIYGPLQAATLSIGSGDVEPGGNIAVPMTVNLDGETLGAATIEIQYDPAVLDATACTEDPGGVLDFAFCNVELAADKVGFTAISAAGVTGDPLLAEITFQAVGDPGASSSLTLTPTTFADPSGQPIIYDVENGQIEITPNGNTAPEIDVPNDVIVDETTSLPVQIDLWAYAEDAETPDSGLTFTIEGSPPPGAGVTIVDNRWLIVDPRFDWCGYTDVTVRVTDPGGLSDEDTLRVAVTWSCKGPLPVPDQQAPQGQLITLDLTEFEPQVGNGTGMFWSVTSEEHCVVTGEGSEDDVLTFTPQSGYVGSDTVKLHMTYPWGGEARQELTLTWRDVKTPSKIYLPMAVNH